MASVPDAKKNGRKFHRLSRVHERYRQTTDRRTGDSIQRTRTRVHVR